MKRPVALVLDPQFGDRVAALAVKMPVWILSSPINDLAVQLARQRLRENQITTLLSRPSEDAEGLLARGLLAIDEHHGIQSQIVSYDGVQVIGTLKKPSRELCSELGFDKITYTLKGFTAQK